MCKTDISFPGGTQALLPDYYSRVPQMKSLCNILDDMMTKFYQNVNRAVSLRLLISEDVNDKSRF